MARKSTRGSRAAANEVHVLDFELDDDADCCSLTVLVKDFRFHITADANDMLGPEVDQEDDKDADGQAEADPSPEAAKLGEEFRGLVAALRKEQEEAEYQGNSGEDQQEDGGEEEPNAGAVAREVKRQKTSEQDKTNAKDQTSTPLADNDSGVDIASPAETIENKKKHKKSIDSNKNSQAADLTSKLSPPLSYDSSSSHQQQNMKSDPETQLRDFMLRPFPPIFERLDPIPETQQGQQVQQNLQEWYSGPTYFYRLYINHESGNLKEKPLDSTTELDNKIVKMVPRIGLAKDLHKLDIPWFEAGDVQVLKAGEHCGLYTPTEVRIQKADKGDGDEDDEVYFFKRVDPLQPAPTHREIRMLRDIEKKGLHEKMNCPVIKGLVRWYGTSKPGSSNQIMGFLQTNIEDSTPLTRMLDSDVVEDKRTKWAKEVEKCVGVLHAAGMVWGDAKADNFMVDRHGKLWIIDFGGSYTEGWVDEELSETVEGDDMGVEKIVGALRDPEGMTYDPEEGIQLEGEEEKEEKHSGGRKRSREDDAEEGEEGEEGEEENKSKRIKN